MMRSLTICTVLAATVITAPLVSAEVGQGDVAPLHRSVDDKMRAIDMADFIDGTPLVFLYGTAT
jgi:hypothetical protein